MTSGRVTEKETKSFAFDKSYWCVRDMSLLARARSIHGAVLTYATRFARRSACPKDDPAYASQQTLFDDLGVDLLDHAFEGFNTCLFAVRAHPRGFRGCCVC